MQKYQVTNYIAFAIPFFFLFIFIELGLSAWLKRKTYRLNDSVNDLTLGIYQQMIGIFYRGIFILLYIYIYESMQSASAHLFTTTVDSTLAWVLSFLAVDFCYYWFHRTSHQVSVVWGSHEPHHSSEEYNLTVALRQGSLQGVFSGWFYMPLAFLGVHPVIYLVCSQFNTIYQFWIHTRLIDKMWAPIEWIFNTPSHHRVHHGKNPKYIDKNHAGTLIIWDRLFKTFQAEEEEPVYGTVKPLASFNPFWANIQYWLHLFKMTLKTRGLMNKLKIWFMKPGYKPADLGEMAPIPEVYADTYRKYDPQLSPVTSRYVLVNFILVLPITLTVIFMGPGALSVSGGVLIACVLFSLLSLGWLMEGRKLAGDVEQIRLMLVASALIIWGIFTNNVFSVSMPALAVSLVLLFWFRQVKKQLPVFAAQQIELDAAGHHPYIAAAGK